MKVVSSDALTKLIQLSKDEFLSKSNTTTVTTSGLKTINGTSILGTGDIDTHELPSQTSQSGKFLTTNGTTVSWASVTADTEVEWATFGTTTYQQISDWVSNNKEVLIKNGASSIYRLVYHELMNTHYFMITAPLTGAIDYITVNSSNVWNIGTTNMQTKLPAGTSGNIVTYSGTAGTVGSATINDIVPAQSGQSGKVLTTNGTAVSWATANGLPDQTGQSGKFLTTNGTTASWAESSGSTITYWDDN